LGKNLLNNLKLSEEVDLEEFKQNLVNARKNKNLSIKEASQILNISESLINKLEEGNFEEINKDIFIIGHIRTYLNFIEIDSKLLINNFKPNKIILRKNNQNIILPYSFNLSRKYIFLISIILFFLLLIIYKEINTLNKINIINNENTEKELENIKGQEKTIQEIEDLEEREVINSGIDEITEKELENIKDQEKATQEIGDLEENEVINTEIDENKIEHQSDDIISSEKENIDFIFIEALEDSWIEIQDNNTKVIVSKIIRKDETTKLPYQKDLILVTGNAGGIIIKIGNNIINKIGESGEVKRNISLNLENLIKFIEE